MIFRLTVWSTTILLHGSSIDHVCTINQITIPWCLPEHLRDITSTSACNRTFTASFYCQTFDKITWLKPMSLFFFFFCTVHILSIFRFYLIDVWSGMSLTKSIFSELVITHSNIRDLYMYLQPGDEPFFLVHLYGWYVPGWILPYIVLSIILDALTICYRTNEKTTKSQNTIKPLHQKLFQWQLLIFAIHLL